MPPLDIMLDLETLGTTPGCAILQIGAVLFDRTTFEINPATFEMTISVEDTEKYDFTASPKTAAWWAMQSQAARDAVFNPPAHAPAQSVFHALDTFCAWWFANSLDGDLTLWTQGNFDAPILEAALGMVGMDTPWKFWMVRDTRTAYDVLLGPDGRKLIKSLPRLAPHHTALGDAVHQVACLKRAYEIGHNRQGKWSVMT